MNLVLLDDLDLVPGTEERLHQATGSALRTYSGVPDTQDELLRRLEGADGALVTWRTPVPAAVLQQCPSLRFVGIAASAFADPDACNVDLREANERHIVVSMLGQYGDEATAEWIIWRMLSAARNDLSWRGKPIELYGKRLGVVGMGPMGRHVAQRGHGLGMDVVYWSRQQRSDVDVPFVQIEELLQTSDVVTLHIAKGATVLSDERMALLRADSLLINTSIGPTVDATALDQWMSANPNAAFIADIVAPPDIHDLATRHVNAFVGLDMAGDTAEMRMRKSDQLVENVAAFVGGHPIRIAPIN